MDDKKDNWLLAPSRTGRPVTGQAYRDRLAAKIREVAAEEGVSADRIRKKVAFDFALRRMETNAPAAFVLKGGYALELRLKIGRSTKDLDFVTKGLLRASMASDHGKLASLLRGRLVPALADAVDEYDSYVSFQVDEGRREIDGGGGGVSFAVKMLVDGGVFEEFHIDLAMEDIDRAEDSIELTPTLPIYPLGGEPLEVSSVTPEQHFAEKLHAYTRPRGEHENSRVKDLVDMVLLVRMGLDPKLTREMCGRVFAYWTTHALPTEIEPPPTFWREPFQRLSAEVGIEELDLAGAYRLVADAVATILK